MINLHYCEHCGAKLTSDAKFCAKCGRELGKGQDTKIRKNSGWLFFVFSIIFSVIGGIVLSANPTSQGRTAAGIIFLVAGFFYLAAIFAFFSWLFRKNKKVALAVLVVIVAASSFSVVYYQTKQAYLSQISAILDIGAEVAYAKSVGDDLIAGREISEAEILLGETGFFEVVAAEKITSMAQVRTKLEKENGLIKVKRVRGEIEPYRASVATWTQSVFDASNFQNFESPTWTEKAKWQNLPTTPTVASLNMRGDQQVSALEKVALGVKQLQTAGDLAIASKDRSAMRQVAAKAQITSSFVDSLTASAPSICAKRGCASEVKSFVTGVYRSAHNYTVGNQGATQEWDNTWKEPPAIIAGAGQPLGGLGITQGGPDPTPPPNKPTTLRSVSPDYKPRTGAPPWDGTYSGNANVSCDAQSSDFADSFADSAFSNFEVRGEKIQGGAVEIAIDGSGHASYDVNVGGINVNSDYYFTQTAGGGVTVSGSFSLYGSESGISMSCSGDFQGSRISL